MAKRIAVIGTGGSIATIGRAPGDLVDYGHFGRVAAIEELLAGAGNLAREVELHPIGFRQLPSEAIGPAEWHELAALVAREAARHDGIVVTHGTSTMEETAWFLDLTVRTGVPVVMVGAQRPPSAAGSDAYGNLADAIRAASSNAVAGLGTVVVMNGEIHAARDVIKSATYRLDAFGSGEAGRLGILAPDGAVVIERRPARPTPLLDFAAPLPRVDIAFGYAGADGAEIAAFVAAGARGIVVAAMLPGTAAPAQMAALEQARDAGVSVVFSTRAGSGPVLARAALVERGFVPGGTLTPQKARILLMLALGEGRSEEAVRALFREA